MKLFVVCSWLLLAAAVSGLAVKSSKDRYAQNIMNDNEELCTSHECVIAAASLIESMDETIDPCEDFYQFVCGGWEASNDIPSTDSTLSQFNVLRNDLDSAMSAILTEAQNETEPLPLTQVKELYNGCMDETTIETLGVTPLTSFLSQSGGWPLATQDWDATTFDWQTVVAESRRQLGAGYFFSIYVYANEKDTFSTITYVDQSSLGLSRSVLLDLTSYESLVAAYKQYIRSAGLLLSGSTVDEATLDADVDALVSFESQLASITSANEDRRDLARMYNPLTVQELSALTGASVDWLSLLNTAFASAGTEFTMDDTVVVRELEFVQSLASLIDSTDSRVLSNYLLWRQVQTLGSETSQAMRDIIFHYEVVASGVTEASPREDVCAGKSNNYLGYAIGTRYVELYFSQEAKDTTNDMVEDLRDAFKELLDINEWMDDETKPVAEEKADLVAQFIGYPDWYDVEGGLESYYTGLTGIDSASHFENIMILKLYLSIDELNALGLPAERQRFLTPPTIVNAFYAPDFNSITFPAGILQPPFYRANTLQVLNYGGIGQVIGHEITHGFDDTGRQYDGYGNTDPWWSNATVEAFSEQAQCVIDQYSGYVVEQIDTNLNGVTTQGENIADNGGLREAYLAYLKYVSRNGPEPRLPGLESYTAEQMFFISNANVWCSKSTDEYLQNQILGDPHSPGPFRVKGTVSNIEQFSTAFSCPSGSPMNPVDKCVVW